MSEPCGCGSGCMLPHDHIDASWDEAGRAVQDDGLDVERLVKAIEREKRGSIRYPEDIGHDMGMAHAQDIVRREARLRA